MTKRKGWTTIIAVVGVVLLLFGIGTIATRQSFVIAQDKVWIPQYLSASCIAKEYPQIQVTTHTDSPTWYHCNSVESKTWIPPNYPGVECVYTIEGAINSVSICKGYTENTNDLPSLFTGFASTDKCAQRQISSKVFTVPAGDTIHIDTIEPFGYASLFVKYPSYGLDVFTAAGNRLQTTDNCLLSSITAKSNPVGVGINDLKIDPGSPFNVATDFQETISRQVVRLSDVRNGELIYINRPGFYYPVIKADDGRLIADTRNGEIADPNIQCIPGAGCSDEAKQIAITQQTCDLYGGTPTGYVSIPNDPSKLCIYSCEGGNPIATDQCISTRQECPVDKPLWSFTTGQCISAIEGADLCPDGSLKGDRIVVESEESTCAGKLLCEIGIADPEISTKKYCRELTFFEQYGLVLVLIAGLLMVGIASYSRYGKRK